MPAPTHSPFSYPGGKFYARKLILQRIPASDIYCEPFVGGSIFLPSRPAGSLFSMIWMQM